MTPIHIGMTNLIALSYIFLKCNWIFVMPTKFTQIIFINLINIHTLKFAIWHHIYVLRHKFHSNTLATLGKFQ
ncbi:hypothetical protein EB815_12175 [Mesorhizobium loti]|nr:hypothetical protein EB815_12175 [Mesorhizobium loti]